MTLETFNKKNDKEVKSLLFQCCGSTKWVDLLMKNFPFPSEKVLVEQATKIWYADCVEADWRAAFTQHPKIGDIKSLEKKFATTKHLAGKEQSGVATASKETIQQLAQANTDYEVANGFIFIVCATGKSAKEMLRLLHDRLKNTPDEETSIAMGEQHKITLIRFKKLLSAADWSALQGSQLTTHVLDTSIGKPGANLTIQLQEFKGDKWQTITQGVTNKDGRIGDLLPASRLLELKAYRMVFYTGDYFEKQEVSGFYPMVEIQFTVLDDQHYHIPLLINPFGYTTYRGS